MKSNKKGSELSINVVVIAAVAILVLVILALFIFDAFDKTKRGTSCEAVKGECMASCSGGFPTPNAGLDGSCDEGYVCCLPLGN